MRSQLNALLDVHMTNVFFTIALVLSSMATNSSFQPKVWQERAERGKEACEAKAKELYEEPPRWVGDEFPMPEKTANALAKFPESDDHVMIDGIWIGFFLISPEGAVVGVWPIREPSFKPPWPEFHKAIPNAIRKWKYEPSVVDGEAVSVCTTVTISIHPR